MTLPYCVYCDRNFIDLNRHIDNNIHIKAVKDDSPKINRLDKYKKHYNATKNLSLIEEVLNFTKLEKEHPYWGCAKKELNEDDYKKLKEYVSGRKDNIKYSRYSGYGGFNRASKGR